MATYNLATRWSIVNKCMAIINAGGKLSRENYIELVRCINVSELGDKLEDFHSVSTGMWNNKKCPLRQKCPGSVCFSCYVKREARKTNLRKALEVNYVILNTFDIPKWAWGYLAIPTVNGNARIESHGETDSVTCACNYIRICKSHRDIHITDWTKNDEDYAEAFYLEGGKPSNMEFVWSSMMINKVDMPREFVNGKPFAKYVDHVFTVFDKGFVLKNNIKINCGKYNGVERIEHKCNGCMKCYYVKGRRYKKSEVEEYRAQIEAMGLKWMGMNYYIFELKK